MQASLANVAYRDPASWAWLYPAETQAALYYNDPLRPRPVEGTPNTAGPHTANSYVDGSGQVRYGSPPAA